MSPLPGHLHNIEYVVQSVVRPATDDEVRNFADALDQKMSELAYGTMCRDEALLAYAMILESAFYLRGWRTLLQDNALEPAIDKIISAYPDDQRCDSASMRSLYRARQWWRPSAEYAELVGSAINVVQGRMAACWSKEGRLIFYPTSDLETELRNRWFDVLLYRHRSKAGTGLLKDNADTRKVAERIDTDLLSQRVAPNGTYSPPSNEPWYRDHCAQIANGVLSGQFAHVAATEAWGKLSKDQIIEALRPIYLRAALRVFGHLRAFKFLREKLGATSPVLRSTVENVNLDALTAEVARSASLDITSAKLFVDSLVRRKGEERYKTEVYPLIPMTAGRALLIPSVVLFSNWPAAMELQTARGKHNPSAIGNERDERHVARIKDALRSAGFPKVGTDILLRRSDGSVLTDLDIVVHSPGGHRVLVIQLKSFVTPSNLIELKGADKDVQEAVKQCRQADDNRGIVQDAIESRFGIKLPTGWSLHQLIVVEVFTGTKPTPNEYPAVSLDWLEAQLAHRRTDIKGLCDSARTLDDAVAHFESVAPVFNLFQPSGRQTVTPFPAAVFAYVAGSYETDV